MIRLTYERKRRGWSQTYVAYHAGLHQPDVSCIERGVLVPSDGRARRLARFLGVPADLLLDEVPADEANGAVG